MFLRVHDYNIVLDPSYIKSQLSVVNEWIWNFIRISLPPLTSPPSSLYHITGAMSVSLSVHTHNLFWKWRNIQPLNLVSGVYRKKKNDCVMGCFGPYRAEGIRHQTRGSNTIWHFTHCWRCSPKLFRQSVLSIRVSASCRVIRSCPVWYTCVYLSLRVS